jgi:tetratricopeptide (TPR) repeat protein
MKSLTFIIVAALALCSVARINTQPKRAVIDESARAAAIKVKQSNIISCSPDLNYFIPGDTGNDIPVLNGWGHYRMPVTATNDSAEIYFEQGINMYYGFHIIEALASFDKATKFDTSFAMGYWGMALAYGPNINDFGYSASPEALVAIRKAKELSANCSAVEKGLIDAIQVRYTNDTTQTREHLNKLYADAMEKVYARFPASADAATLYVDALMVQHPWELYTKTYQPKQWTPEIVNTLEKILNISPKHPGASHYYIHAVEASAHPEKAMTVSEQLASLMPGVSHVVHMPSHIFIRSGYYSLGEQTNEKAVKGYYDYLSKYPAVINNAPLYLVHNLHMQATCANMDGTFAIAMQSSVDCKNSFDSSWQAMPDYFGVFIQYVYMTPYLTLIRFGKWDDILNAPENPTTLIYANLIWHYGQGLAHSRKHDFISARKHLDSLQQKLNNDQLNAPAPSYANPGINGAIVAEKVLQGVIAEEQNDLTTSISFLKQAVAAEDSMIYNEPKDWVHPARQYLGNVLLKSKQYAEAERVYKEDLVINPHNGWSLTGLVIALEKQNKKSAAAKIRTEATKAFKRSDLKITASVF